MKRSWLQNLFLSKYLYLLTYFILAFHLISSSTFAQQPEQSEWIALAEADLQPISLGKNEDKIRRALRIKNWDYAARLIDPQTPYLKFLKGWFLIQAESWSQSLKYFQDLVEHPLLDDEVNALMAQAYFKLDQAQEAEDVGAKVSQTDHVLWRETLRIRGQALRSLQRWSEAIQVYQELGKSEVEFDQGISALGIAMVAVEQGEAQKGIQLLKIVDIEYTGLWVASQAQREARQLYQTRPKLKKLWFDRSSSDRLNKLEGWLSRGKQNKVIKKVDQLLKESLSDDLRCRALIAKGRAFDKMRARRKALKALKLAVELCHPQRHPKTPLALYVAGRAASVIDDYQNSNYYFNILLTEYKHKLSDDAAVFMVRHEAAKFREKYNINKPVAKLIKAKLLSKSQRKKLAKLSKKKSKELDRIVDIIQAVVKHQPNGDLASEAVTFAVVALLRAGRLDLAKKVIGLGETLPVGEFRFHDAGRILYWKARITALEGNKTLAVQLYQKVITNAPLSWYALMAYSRLYEFNTKEAKKTVTDSISWTPTGLGLPGGEQHLWDWRFHKDDPHWALMKRALMWMRMGLMKRGRRAFRELASDKNRPDLQWLSAWALDGYQQYHWSHDIPRRKLIEYRHFPPNGYHLKHWHIAYPAPFQKEVLQASTDEEVEAQFIWGVMREESGYAERIRSSASAVGLLQLILTTAKMMRRGNEPEVTIERLGIPSVNIPLGARYLAWVKRTVDCAWSLVPAGYNAGGGALKKWIKNRGYLPLDVFVETIPYEEARWYNKRVIASWITFRTVYGAPKGQFIWPYVSQRTLVPEDSPAKKTRAKTPQRKRSIKRKSSKAKRKSKSRKSKQRKKNSKKRR